MECKEQSRAGTASARRRSTWTAASRRFARSWTGSSRSISQGSDPRLPVRSTDEAGAGHAHTCGYGNAGGRICVMVAQHC